MLSIEFVNASVKSLKRSNVTNGHDDAILYKIIQKLDKRSSDVNHLEKKIAGCTDSEILWAFDRVRRRIK